MNKEKILGDIIASTSAMTGLCTEISQNVISGFKSVYTKKNDNSSNVKKTKKQ